VRTGSKLGGDVINCEWGIVAADEVTFKDGKEDTARQFGTFDHE